MRSKNRMAFTAARMSVLRGRPPGRAGGPLNIPQVARIAVALPPVNPAAPPSTSLFAITVSSVAESPGHSL